MAVGAFSAALTGLNANAQSLSVIGNNLANINTIGFKSSSVTFMDLVSQTVGGTSVNPMQVGLGVATGSIAPVFSQGAIENTREATNVAIQGNGLFIVRGASGVAYTRAGNFSFNSEGKLVTPDGYFVQGYMEIDPLTGEVVNSGQPTDISVPPGELRAPHATGEFRLLTNLDAAAEETDTFSTALQVVDALGGAHVVTITYTKGAVPGEWTYAITVPGADVDGGVPGVPSEIAAGSLTFGDTGLLTGVDGGLPADVAITTPVWSNGASASTFSWDIVDDDETATLTGYASPSTTSSIEQDGTPAGMIDSVSIMSDGTILAMLGGGQSVAVGQLALASFNNPKGLVKLGSSRFGESQAAGIPNVGVAGTGGRGTLIGSALEQSNVDIAQEFTQMILAQRGYQANAKTITVSDELLVDTLNLKR